jgi:hypothetical protein
VAKGERQCWVLRHREPLVHLTGSNDSCTRGISIGENRDGPRSSSGEARARRAGKADAVIAMYDRGQSDAPRVKALFGRSRDLGRIVYRDPEHVPERLTLTSVQRLGEPSLAWAQAAIASRPDVDLAVIAEELRLWSAGVARIDGAIAGTPFFIALVPGYLGYLSQEALMVLRTAALYGRDPRDLRVAAELLALRGVHPSVEAAQTALERVRATPLPDKPPRRRPLRNWTRSIYMVLVLGGFLASPADRNKPRAHGRLLAVAGALLGVMLWVMTWVLPLTFIIAMAWSCERDTRKLGRRAHAYYGGQAPTTKAAIAAARSGHRRGHDKQRVIRTIALGLSIAVPIAFVAYADHIRNTNGVNALSASGALVALSLVIATAVVTKRR